MVRDDAEVDNWGDLPAPRYLRFLGRFRFAHTTPPSLIDRFEYATTQRIEAQRKAHIIFTFATLLPLTIGRFIAWAYLERFDRFVVAVVITPFAIAVLNALPVTNWVVPDGVDPIGAWFQPDLIAGVPSPEVPSPEVPAAVPGDVAPVDPE